MDKNRAPSEGEPTTEPPPRFPPPISRGKCWRHAASRPKKQAIADYDRRLRQAEDFGDVGLKVNLENQLADETRHKEEIERVLVGWDRPAGLGTCRKSATGSGVTPNECANA